MDVQSHLSRLRGPRSPLTVPVCMLAHTAQVDARAQEVEYLANCLAPYEGFDFGTFQVVEHNCRTTPSLKELSEFNDWPAPDLMWDLVFPSVLDAFFGADLDEIDVQMYMQHRLGIYSRPMRVPRADFAPELGPKPTGMLAVPGIEMAAFSFEIQGRRNIRPARRWLAEVFIPQWIAPLLHDPQSLPQHFIELGFLDIRPN
jgi:hypothetical protein